MILYAYSESSFARRNLEFFLDHALHSAADFIFILNGETDAKDLIFPPEQYKNSGQSPARRDEVTYSAPEEAASLLKPRQATKERRGEGGSMTKEQIAAKEQEKAEAAAAAKAEIAKEEQEAEDARQQKLANPLPVHRRDNVRVIHRQNRCYDLGAHAEVLNSDGSGEGWFSSQGPIGAVPLREPQTNETITFGTGFPDLALRHRYKKYILMNASIRGPFVPTWSPTCWSDAYLNRVSDIVKLVGMSYNCFRGKGHLQSMIWATDSVGLQELLMPEAIGNCPRSMQAAIDHEIGTTAYMRSRGYEVDAFLSVYHSQDRQAKSEKVAALQKEHPGLELEEGVALDKPGQWWHDQCGDHADFLKPVQEEDSEFGYYGSFVHPFENLWFKSHRGIEEVMLRRLTGWVDGQGYESYDHCH